MKVYVVTEGSYSDYHIDCVCIDKEKAQLIVQANPYAEIEEFEVFDAMPDKYTIHTAITHLLHNQEVGETSYTQHVEWNFNRHPNPMPSSRPDVSYQKYRFGPHSGTGNLVVTGLDLEAVGKVTSERIAAFKSGSWRPAEVA